MRSVPLRLDEPLEKMMVATLSIPERGSDEYGATPPDVLSDEGGPRLAGAATTPPDDITTVSNAPLAALA